MKACNYPGASEFNHPDNVLSANQSASAEAVGKIKAAITNLAGVFGVKDFQEFDPVSPTSSLELINKGTIYDFFIMSFSLLQRPGMRRLSLPMSLSAIFFNPDDMATFGAIAANGRPSSMLSSTWVGSKPIW